MFFIKQKPTLCSSSTVPININVDARHKQFYTPFRKRRKEGKEIQQKIKKGKTGDQTKEKTPKIIIIIIIKAENRHQSG